MAEAVRLFPSCRSITEFERLNVINEGTYGKVCASRSACVSGKGV